MYKKLLLIVSLFSYNSNSHANLIPMSISNNFILKITDSLFNRTVTNAEARGMKRHINQIRTVLKNGEESTNFKELHYIAEQDETPNQQKNSRTVLKDSPLMLMYFNEISKTHTKPAQQLLSLLFLLDLDLGSYEQDSENLSGLARMRLQALGLAYYVY
jgi:hypothetical protein